MNFLTDFGKYVISSVDQIQANWINSDEYCSFLLSVCGMHVSSYLFILNSKLADSMISCHVDKEPSLSALDLIGSLGIVILITQSMVMDCDEAT